MVPPPRLPPKKDVAIALLEQSMVFVHLDPRNEAVKVPPWFKKQPQLVLQLGLNMAIPIPDLDVGDEGISCTLSFDRAPHYCWIPWTSVYALVGDKGRGMVWPDDVPREVAAQTAQQPRQEPAPKLRAVADEEKPAAKPKKKKARKTKTAAAAPAAKATKASAPRAAARRAAEPPATLVEPAAEATQGSASSGADSKRKRELPPYLRVIK
jgi:stringent starvation protein B